MRALQSALDEENLGAVHHNMDLGIECGWPKNVLH
jgi:hypothetical protein